MRRALSGPSGDARWAQLEALDVQLRRVVSAAAVSAERDAEAAQIILDAMPAAGDTLVRRRHSDSMTQWARREAVDVQVQRAAMQIGLDPL